jgi:hypothetical protein
LNVLRFVFLCALLMVGCGCGDGEAAKDKKPSQQAIAKSHDAHTWRQSHVRNTETAHIPELCRRCKLLQEKLKQEIIEEVLERLQDQQ